MAYTFKKEERLSSKKMIDTLFARTDSVNRSFLIYPVKVVFRTEKKEPENEAKLPKVLISVSKRHFKKAVSRNLIKRRLRESYRLNKQLISTTDQAFVAFIYVAKEILDYQAIEKSVTGALKRINHLLKTPASE